MKRVVLIGILACLVYASVCAAAGEQPITVDELLDKIEQSQDECNKVRSYILKTENSSQSQCSFMGPGNKSSYEHKEYYTDGKRYYKTKKEWGNCMKDANVEIPEDDPKLKAWLWDGNINYFWGRSSQKFAAYYAQRKYKTDDERACFVKRTTGSATISRDKPKQIKPFIRLKNGGMMGDVDRIDRILRKVDKVILHEKMALAGNSKCYVVRARSSKYGNYEVWIDPAHGYNIAKAKMYKGLNHQKRTSWPTAKGATIKYEYDNVKFKKIAGMWIPMEADYKYDEKHASGDYNRSTDHRKRTELILNPVFDDKAFSPKIPDGYSVRSTFIDQVPGEKKKYTWQDGAVVDADGNKVDLEKLVKKTGK